MAYINNGNAYPINAQVLEWYYQAASSIPVQPPTATQTVNAHVVPGLRDEMVFDHTLQTAAVVPAFTTTWNTTVMPRALTANTFNVQFSVTSPTKNGTVDYAVSLGTRLLVAAGSETKTITHSLGATADIFIATDWNTNTYRTAKAAGSMTVAFSAPPSENSYLYWSAHDDIDDLTGTETVADGALTHTITHNAGDAFLPIFLLPNWNTQCRVYLRNDPNFTVISFSNAPSGPGEMDYRVKYV